MTLGGKAVPSVGSFSLQGDLPPSLQVRRVPRWGGVSGGDEARSEEVLTLSQWDETHILLRIGHQFGIGEDIVLLLPHHH